ncbi:MAG: type II toxin-antitoxin system HicB family antitoxin [Bauldia sp.]|nr:type II toxin-antitoxin system HicB family antitoxin [Bauldia sp.]
MTRYVALIDGKRGAYGVSFPDAPGCTAMGATLEEALRNAAAALAEWVADELGSGRSAPEARSFETLRKKEPDVAAALAEGATLGLVPLILDSGRSTNVNVSIDRGLLAAIDEAASHSGVTRSAFLAAAARERLLEV